MDEAAFAEVNAAVVDMSPVAGIEKEQIAPAELVAGEFGAVGGLVAGCAGDGDTALTKDIIDKTGTIKTIRAGLAVCIGGADFAFGQRDELVEVFGTTMPIFLGYPPGFTSFRIGF